MIFDDEAGAIAKSADARRMLGELLDSTHHLSVVVSSHEPVYASLGATKVVNMGLRGLGPHDTARLFFRRTHRPLRPGDLVRGGSLVDSIAPEDAEESMRRLAAQTHPLRGLEGNPGAVRALSAQVTPALPSLFDLLDEAPAQLRDPPNVAVSEDLGQGR